MTGVPTFATPPGFLGLPFTNTPAALSVAGIPLDIGTTNRAGTRSGPAAIRAASRMLVDGAHPVSGVDPATLSLADLGEFAIALGDIQSSLALIEQQAAAIPHLLALGGEHGVTLALLRALFKRTGAPLGLLHVDAHCDTWPESFGQEYGHGSVFFHALNEGLIDPHRTIQIGIRATVQVEVAAWAPARGVTVLSAQDVHAQGIAATIAQARAVLGTGPAYLSFDIDALDPAFAPGTGTPEIGDLASWQAQALIRGMAGLDWRGMDVVEVAPAYDVSEITALAAATLAWEYVCMVGQAWGK